MRNQLDMIHKERKIVNQNIYQMDYSNFAAMLPVKVTFSKNELEPLSKRSISERMK